MCHDPIAALSSCMIVIIYCSICNHLCCLRCINRWTLTLDDKFTPSWNRDIVLVSIEKSPLYKGLLRTCYKLNDEVQPGVSLVAKFGAANRYVDIDSKSIYFLEQDIQKYVFQHSYCASCEPEVRRIVCKQTSFSLFCLYSADTIRWLLLHLSFSLYLYWNL